jgi:NADPH:quinone reductase-like Zn-dependent oxidoreductase
MKAIRIARFGGPEVLALSRIDLPSPGAGELLVKMRAASVNPVDWKIRAGKYPEVPPERLPYTLGRDLAGEIVARGAGADGFADGTSIFAFVGIDRGTFAEYVVVHGNEVAPRPITLDDTAAAAVPLAGLTAWQGLFRHGGLTSGQRVLIHGGSGGVGHFAIQFAKARGAHVTTTVSPANVEFARALGADEVIDRTRQKFDEEVRDLDVVFDLIGGETQERSWALLKPGGILVSTVSAPPPEKAETYAVRGTRYTAQPNAFELGEIASLIDAGKVRPHVSRTYALDEAGMAMREVESGHTVGKVVLTSA